MSQFIQLFATIIVAAIGAWFGARTALRRFERERAFDRRLEWYEQTVKAIHALGLRAHEAAERERHNFPIDIRNEAWNEAVKAYDNLAPLLLVSELYGLPFSIRVTERIALRMSEAGQATDRVEYYSSMSKELRQAASQIAGECREHLRMKRLSKEELLEGHQDSQASGTQKQQNV